MSPWDQAELFLGIVETGGAQWLSIGCRIVAPEMGDTHHPVALRAGFLVGGNLKARV